MNTIEQQHYTMFAKRSKDSKYCIVLLSGVADHTNLQSLSKNISRILEKEFSILIIDFEAAIYISPSVLDFFKQIESRLLEEGKQFRISTVPEILQEIFDHYGSRFLFHQYRDLPSSITGENNHSSVVVDDMEMTQKVFVFGELELIDAITKGQIPDRMGCISIRNPNEVIPDEIIDRFEHLLELKFYDAYKIEHLGPHQIPQRIPVPDDAKRVVNFIDTTRENCDGYIIHCWQGVSRSTAVAMGVLYRLYGSESTTKRILKKVRSVARPHMGIVEYFDSLYNSKLGQVAQEIRDERLIELKNEIDGL